MGNRSLDDFLGGEASEPDSAEHAEADGTEPAGEGEANGETSGDATRVDPEAAEPAATTYAAGPGECAACGEAARERWRGEAGLVCPACKEW